MGTEVAKKEGGRSAVASISALKGNLAKVRGTIKTTGGNDLLRMLTDGSWVFGQGNTEIAKGKDRLAVNPEEIKVGYVCWTNYPASDKRKNELLGEQLVPLGHPEIDPANLPDKGWEWKQCISLDMKFMDGKNKGKQVVYKTNSVGGLNMIQSIIDAIMVQIDEDEDHPVPVIVLDSDHYDHRSYGRTYTPEFEIVDWLSMDGIPADEDEDEGEEEEEEAPKTRKRKAKKPEPEPEPEPEEEEEEEEEEDEDEDEEEEAPAAPARRRRR